MIAIDASDLDWIIVCDNLFFVAFYFRRASIYSRYTMKIGMG
ncbi:hypothetical protein CSUNSWCD_70 [Campylobacter showae CSUNSWCD]|uniref:Uncharacterized protein n=1 Tax=Campylobacter showae CSUNSWCD TaxID=1244083 RepID=M5ILP7_9BACT|nr:hypothetical protein CSUNSWCD_70 [Campylobacter showae CSUNSWCD]